MRRLMLSLLCVLSSPVLAMAAQHTHGLSIFGDLKYPAGFNHFDYVNPDAPKGGRFRTIGTSASLTFDSFNPYIVRGSPANGLDLLTDSLMVRSYDEPDAVYGLIADWAEVADDKRSVTFHLRPEAKWSDGKPITAEDCAFTLTALKEKGDPSFALALRDVAGAGIVDAQTVRYQFAGDNLRDLPILVALLPVLSKAFYTGRDFATPSLDVPISSGPYSVGTFEAKSFITYQRRTDYWAKTLPVNVGRYNFDSIKIDYFGERTAGLQAFLAGDLDFREEFSSRDWAKSYDAPAVKTGKILRQTPPDKSPSGTQGFFFNLRKDKFADPRTRSALDLAFDFEWTKKNLFFGSYQRTQSYFENSPLKAEGKPSVAELALLEPLRAQLPAEAFGEVAVPATSDGSGQDRANLTKARELLKAAGWVIKAGNVVDAKGAPFTIEFLLEDTSFERVIGPYIKNLQVLGIAASIRVVDPAQYEERRRRFDFDVVSARYTNSSTPGIELRNLYSSVAADSPNSNNLGGIKNKAIDVLIETVASAKSRPELETATRALDRVLRSGHYWVPEWFNDVFRFAFWDRFASPATSPPYARGPGDSINRGVADIWWYDKDKDAKLAGP